MNSELGVVIVAGREIRASALDSRDKLKDISGRTPLTGEPTNHEPV